MHSTCQRPRHTILFRKGASKSLPARNISPAPHLQRTLRGKLVYSGIRTPKYPRINTAMLQRHPKFVRDSHAAGRNTTRETVRTETYDPIWIQSHREAGDIIAREKRSCTSNRRSACADSFRKEELQYVQEQPLTTDPWTLSGRRLQQNPAFSPFCGRSALLCTRFSFTFITPCPSLQHSILLEHQMQDVPHKGEYPQ